MEAPRDVRLVPVGDELLAALVESAVADAAADDVADGAVAGAR